MSDQALTIHQRLLDHYGEPTWRQHREPVAELVSTILSQNTSDTNRDTAFDRLRQRLPTWEQVRDAPVDEIVEAIRPAGLANQKAPRIKAALQRITQERGELSLDFLADLPVDQARDWLTDLKGVGPKTAAIVLLFSLNRPAFPVDTHVHRVTQRLGLIPPKASAAKAHDLLEDMLPEEIYYPFHLNVIRHGRRICGARNPRCPECFLTDLCRYYQKRVE